MKTLPYDGTLKSRLTNCGILLHPYRVWSCIFREELNRRHRGRLLLNYLSWYCYHKPRNRTFEITLQNGLKSIVYPDSDSGVSNIFTRNVDYFENRYIRSVLERGDFIVDAGCNVGNRTLVLADIIGGALLIDANPVCLERLIKIFGMNGINLENYHLLAKAVGSERRQVVFSDMGGTACMNRVLSAVDPPPARTREVEMTTIDEEMRLLGDPACSFIKLDLEGYDFEGLIGAKRTLSRGTVRLVKFERWPNTSLQAFERFFQSIGWAIFGLDSRGSPTLDRQEVLSSSNLFAKPGHL